MTDLRAKVIRLAHEHPEFRSQLLPLVKSAGNMGEAMLEKMADQANATSKEIESILNVMERTLRLVENAHPTATKRFDVSYSKILKAGVELASHAEGLLDYTDSFEPQGDIEKEFVAVRRMLHISMEDWKKNLRKAVQGGGLLAGPKLVEAKMAGGYVMQMAEWIQALAGTLS